MRSVVLVDWLGRGGIAQCTAAWDLELRSHGTSVSVLTRGGRELNGAHVEGSMGPGRLRAHVALTRMAASSIIEARPDVVIIQNWIIPAFERQVHDAARRVGAKVFVVVHDHRMHSSFGGIRAGLRSLLRKADGVYTHSEFVQKEVEQYAGRSAEVLPLPVQVAMLAEPRPQGPVYGPCTGLLLGVHFGIVKRSYKGSSVVLGLAGDPPPGWEFAIVGVGAPPARPNLVSIDRFLRAGELCSLVSEAAATVLPYQYATQSGAVVLAQACGSIPVASAVGGVVEQIEDGVTGRLVPPHADLSVWRRVLSDLDDPEVRQRIGGSAAAAARDQHRRFVKAAVRLVS